MGMPGKDYAVDMLNEADAGLKILDGLKASKELDRMQCELAMKEIQKESGERILSKMIGKLANYERRMDDDSLDELSDMGNEAKEFLEENGLTWEDEFKGRSGSEEESEEMSEKEASGEEEDVSTG